MVQPDSHEGARGRNPMLGCGPYLVWLLTSPVFQAVGAVIAAVIIGLGLYATQLYTSTISPTCDELPVASLDVAEIVALQDRFDDYKRHPLPEASIGLTAREFNFATRVNAYGFRSHAEFFDDVATIRAVVPRDDGRCHNVVFNGKIHIRNGVAWLQPETLTVGKTELAGWSRWWYGDAGMPLHPEQLPDETSAEHLANVESLEIDGSMVVVRLRDRWGMW